MKKSRLVWKYRVLAIVAFLFTVGLCFVPTFFQPYNYSFDFSTNTAFSFIKDFIATFSGESWRYVFPKWAMYPLFGAIVVSLVGLVVSLFSKKARGVFITTAMIDTFLLSAFAAIIRYHATIILYHTEYKFVNSLYSAPQYQRFLFTLGGDKFVNSLYAAPTLLAFVNALLLIIGVNLDKKGSVAKTLSFVFASLSAVGVSHAVLSIKGQQFSGMDLHVFEKGLPSLLMLLGATESMANVLAYGFTALLVVVAVKYFVAIFTTNGNKTKVDVFSLIFNVLQVAISVALYVLCIVQFKESFDAFGVYGLFAVLLFGILGIVFACTHKRKNVAPQVTATDVDGQMQLCLDGVSPETEKESASAPAVVAEMPATETVSAPAEGQISMEEVKESATLEEKPAVAEDVTVEEVVTPVYPTVEIPAEQVYTEPQPVYAAPQAQYNAPYPAMPVPTMQGNDYFYASLTPEERKQFDDLFIHCVLGENTRLPRYVVGGNNTEFFRKVFIFIGRYRAYISTSLLEKLYTHASRA